MTSVALSFPDGKVRKCTVQDNGEVTIGLSHKGERYFIRGKKKKSAFVPLKSYEFRWNDLGWKV